MCHRDVILKHAARSSHRAATPGHDQSFRSLRVSARFWLLLELKMAKSIFRSVAFLCSDSIAANRKEAEIRSSQESPQIASSKEQKDTETQKISRASRH